MVYKSVLGEFSISVQPFRSLWTWTITANDFEDTGIEMTEADAIKVAEDTAVDYTLEIMEF